MRRSCGAMLPVIPISLLIAACGSALNLTHTETACVMPGGTVTVQATTDPGAVISYRIQDDFGGDIGQLGPVTVGSDGRATATWKAPAQLSTTTLHFILTAVNGDRRANRDIHVIVGGNGRSC